MTPRPDRTARSAIGGLAKLPLELGFVTNVRILPPGVDTESSPPDVGFAIAGPSTLGMVASGIVLRTTGALTALAGPVSTADPE